MEPGHGAGGFTQRLFTRLFAHSFIHAFMHSFPQALLSTFLHGRFLLSPWSQEHIVLYGQPIL